MRLHMPTYKLVSKDYPSGTYTSISIIPEKNARASSSTLNVQLPLPHQLIYDSDFDWSSENMSLAMTKFIDAGTNAVTGSMQGIRTGQQLGDVVSDVAKRALSDTTEAGQATGIQNLKKMITNITERASGVTGASG